RVGIARRKLGRLQQVDGESVDHPASAMARDILGGEPDGQAAYPGKALPRGTGRQGVHRHGAAELLDQSIKLRLQVEGVLSDRLLQLLEGFGMDRVGDALHERLAKRLAVQRLGQYGAKLRPQDLERPRAE